MEPEGEWLSEAVSVLGLSHELVNVDGRTPEVGCRTCADEER